MALFDDFPWIRSYAEKLRAQIAADPAFITKVLAGEIDEDGRPIPRSPQAVERVKQAMLLTGRIGYLGRRAIEPTGSFVGGSPDSCSSFEWPSWQGRNLIFLAQIDLGDLRSADPPEWLPSSGKLLFFMGDDKEYIPGACRVIHVSDGMHSDTSAAQASQRQYLNFERHMTYPYIGPQNEVLQIDDRNELDDWWDKLIPSRNSVLWQLGGWALPMQWASDMQHECERVYRGWTWEDREAQNRPDFQQAKETWHLIGQFYPEAIMSKPAGCMGGFFWVKVENGEALFDKAWLVGQSN